METVKGLRGYDTEGNFHIVDKGGNHFVGAKCVNPKEIEEAEIGDTIPEEVRFSKSGVSKTGSITLVEKRGRFYAEV